jgi:hypothetical protein
MLSPGARDAIGRETRPRLMTQLHDVQGRLNALKRRLDIEEIRRWTEAGRTLAQIGETIGASSTRVRLTMVRAGIPRRPKGGTRQSPRLDVDEIRRRPQAGQSVGGIARAIGAVEIGVKKVVQRWGFGRAALVTACSQAGRTVATG